MNTLTVAEKKLFKKLSTAIKIQDYLDSIPFNYEKNGETCMSPRQLIKQKKAHCIEGALFAGAVLWFHNKEPLLINFKVNDARDQDHIITVYSKNGYYGAISKTNHNVLRFRDPVYKTIRELVLSYYHEYFLNKTGKKTLLGYTKPISLKKFGTSWITSTKDLWEIAEYMYDAPIIHIVPKKNKKFIRKACDTERKGASILEWKK